MTKKRTLNEIRQTKDSVYNPPKSHDIKKITKEEASRKIVEYFNQHEMAGGKWDSIMYTQKEFVMELLKKLI